MGTRGNPHADQLDFDQAVSPSVSQLITVWRRRSSTRPPQFSPAGSRHRRGEVGLCPRVSHGALLNPGGDSKNYNCFSCTELYLCILGGGVIGLLGVKIRLLYIGNIFQLYACEATSVIMGHIYKVDLTLTWIGQNGCRKRNYRQWNPTVLQFNPGNSTIREMFSMILKYLYIFFLHYVFRCIEAAKSLFLGKHLLEVDLLFLFFQNLNMAASVLSVCMCWNECCH